MPSQYTSLSLNFAHHYCLLRKFDLSCINILLYSVLWSKSSSIFNCCWDSCNCTKNCGVTLVSTKLSIHFFGKAFRSISNSKMKFDVILSFSLILIGHSLKSCNTSAVVISPHWAQCLKSKDFPLNFSNGYATIFVPWYPSYLMALGLICARIFGSIQYISSRMMEYAYLASEPYCLKHLTQNIAYCNIHQV